MHFYTHKERFSMHGPFLCNHVDSGGACLLFVKGEVFGGNLISVNFV